MNITRSHELLAEKFMHRKYWKGVLVPDSMRSLVALAYTEEEAEVVLALGFATMPAMMVARRVKRPVDEVAPILASLADRLLITELTIKGVKTFGFLNFVPGVFEAQMIRAKSASTEKEREYFRRFAELFEQFYEEIITWLKPNLGSRSVRVGRIIPVGKSIEHATGILPLGSDAFSEIIDRNNSFCLVEVCACRHEMELLGKGCGKPMDVCSAMGWLADFCIEKGLARRVSKEEYIDAKTRAAEAGLVNLTDNLRNPLQVCSCCSCCCGVLRMISKHNFPTLIAASPFEAAVDDATCNSCGICSRACPTGAIQWTKKKPVRIDYARCIGCGVCVNTCDEEKAMSLRARGDYAPPSKTILDFYADRYLEMNDDVQLGPRVKLGISRLLGKVSPLSVSGPGYRPPK